MEISNKILNYLTGRNCPVSIGEINKEEQFKDIERREIAKRLQKMAADREVFRSLKDGKAYYSVNEEEGLGRNGRTPPREVGKRWEASWRAVPPPQKAAQGMASPRCALCFGTKS